MTATACRPTEYPPHEPDPCTCRAAGLTTHRDACPVRRADDRRRAHYHDRHPGTASACPCMTGPAPVSPWARRAMTHTLPPSAHGARAYAR